MSDGPVTGANQNAVVGYLVSQQRPDGTYRILGVSADRVWHAYYAEFFAAPEYRQAQNDDTYGRNND